MDTERFNFNIKPGEPGFKELGKNKFGHTVLNQNQEEINSPEENVHFGLDESGTMKASVSIWDSSSMKELANKFNLPLESEDSQNQDVEEEEEEISKAIITAQDMDDLLKDIETNLEEPSTTGSVIDNVVYYSRQEPVLSNTHGIPGDRMRKVARNVSESDLKPEKQCTSTECNETLPLEAKFCSTCGKLQKVTLYCIECGRKFNEREKFCADCGCVRK